MGLAASSSAVFNGHVEPTVMEMVLELHAASRHASINTLEMKRIVGKLKGQNTRCSSSVPMAVVSQH